MGNANAKSPDFLAIVTRFQSGARHRPCTPCRAHCQPPLAVVDSLDWAWGCRTLKWGYCTGVSDHRVLLDTDIHRSCSDAYAHVCVTPPSLVLCWCRAPQISIPTFDGFPESAERGKNNPLRPPHLSMSANSDEHRTTSRRRVFNNRLLRCYSIRGLDAFSFFVLYSSSRIRCFAA